MSPLRFLWRHAPVLGFGLLLAFSSSFGQTFFISLFVSDLRATFDVSKSEFGGLYSIATIASAFTLPLLGPLIDKRPARLLAGIALVGIAASAFLLSRATWIPVCVVGLYGMRMFGQGFSGLLSSTTLARYFESGRGLALGVSSLGHPIGEALLPAAFALPVVAELAWRSRLVAVSAAVVMILLPVVVLILGRRATVPDHFRVDPREDLRVPRDAPERPRVQDWTRARFFKAPAVWCLMPAWMFSAFALTGLFFHQESLVEEKHWTAPLYAAAFVGFAIGRGVSAFAFGPLVDRFTGTRLFWLTLLPIISGVALLVFLDETSALFAYLALAGVSVGASGPVRASLLAERFGVAHLGSIKSSLMPIAVLSTALAPPIFGFALDEGARFSSIAMALSILGAASLALAVFGLKRLQSLSARSESAT